MTTQIDFVSPSPAPQEGRPGGDAGARRPRKAAPARRARAAGREQLDLFAAPTTYGTPRAPSDDVPP